MPRCSVRGLLALVAVLATLTVACSSRPSGGAPALEPIGELGAGEELPAAQLPFLDGEGALDTTDLGGKPSVWNFWATWCAFCVDEMPDLEQVSDELGGQVRFVGVNREDNPEKARTLAEETGVTFELVRDDDASFFRAVQGRGMPTTVFVNEDGTIAYRHAGPLDVATLRELVEEHLGVS